MNLGDNIIKVYIEDGSVISDVKVFGSDNLFQMLETLLEGIISNESDTDKKLAMIKLITGATALATQKSNISREELTILLQEAALKL